MIYCNAVSYDFSSNAVSSQYNATDATKYKFFCFSPHLSDSRRTRHIMCILKLNHIFNILKTAKELDFFCNIKLGDANK